MQSAPSPERQKDAQRSRHRENDIPDPKLAPHDHRAPRDPAAVTRALAPGDERARARGRGKTRAPQNRSTQMSFLPVFVKAE